MRTKACGAAGGAVVAWTSALWLTPPWDIAATAAAAIMASAAVLFVAVAASDRRGLPKT